MQTFLPYRSFSMSALALDKKRCWKQVVEAKQIIEVLEGRSVAWKNHPAVLMWAGHPYDLKDYFNIFLNVCLENHKINTSMEPYLLRSKGVPPPPWWLGNKDFHRAMRSRLIEKNKEHYLPLFPDDEGFNGGKYMWPVMESKTFRTI